MLSLRQGSSSVSAYSIDFRILATECGWDDKALQGIFYRGLSDEVKDELAARDGTTSLEELISLAIRLDNRLRERHRERAVRSRSNVSISQPRNPSLPELPAPPLKSTTSSEEPLQLGRMRLSQERTSAYTVVWLATFCSNVPSDQKSSLSASGGALVSHMPVDSSSKRIQLKGTVSFNTMSLPILALVDSGADDNFIDSEFVSQAKIPTELLPEPKKVFALDGRVLAIVTHRTVPVSLLVSGNHCELISLYIAPSPSASLVLGLPWFRLHNPHIDWPTQSLSNWSLFCLSHCLHSAVPSTNLHSLSPPRPVISPSRVS